MNEKISPCPFCGGTEISVRKPATSIGLTRIACGCCGAFAAFQGKHMRDVAAEFWNRRDGGGAKTELRGWECPDCTGKFWVDCDDSDCPNCCAHCGLENLWAGGMRLVRSDETTTTERGAG